jgi:dipeptidyl aminopeptidase/acylaminoacyl peptidase
MKYFTVLLMLILFASLPGAALQAQSRRPLTFDDLISPRRVSDPQISPDGQWIVCPVIRHDLGKNAANSDIWRGPNLESPPQRLILSAQRDNCPRWSSSNFVKNFKSPMLVIRSEPDYRLPVSEGFQHFTALQLVNASLPLGLDRPRINELPLRLLEGPPSIWTAIL